MITRKKYLLFIFCKTNYDHFAFGIKFFKSFYSGIKLSFSPINDYQLGERLTFRNQSFIPSENSFLHGGKVIYPLHRFNIEMPIIFFVWLSILESDHGRYREAAVEI